MTSQSPTAPAWGAVAAMALGIFGIVAAEFLPASLLTPIAQSLQISEGLAGQSITVTAAVALAASLLIAAITSRIDRRRVLACLTLLLVLSNVMVAMASNFTTLLLARVLLGVALGGFWSLSPATMMRLVPPADIPKALAILFGGVSAATVLAAPFSSFFGALLGWRAVFAAAAGLGIIAFVVQLITLPSMRASGAARIGTLFALLARPKVGLALFAILLVFCGHFMFFSYLRPFLEAVTALDPFGITIILLVFGVGTFVGNSLASLFIRTSLGATIVLMPLLMAVLAVVLSVFGGTSLGDALLVGLWGAAFGVVPRRLVHLDHPDHARRGRKWRRPAGGGSKPSHHHRCWCRRFDLRCRRLANGLFGLCGHPCPRFHLGFASQIIAGALISGSSPRRNNCYSRPACRRA